jgi:dipeptidyl-peptidase-4
VSAGDSFPRQEARTRRFTLGRPRTFTVAPDGSRVVFLRSGAGDDPVTALWVLDVATGEERRVVDPRQLGGDDGDLPAAERARRERAREAAGGVVAYATDVAVTVAAFAIGGRLHVADLTTGATRSVDTAGPVLDPRPAPGGGAVAYVTGGALHLVDLVTVSDARVAPVAGDEVDGVTWGLAEFVAAEEMNRFRGYWWDAVGERLAVARVDERPVATWWIADPSNPGARPTPVRYSAAGTPNADVDLFVVAAVGGAPTAVPWDRDRYPYLIDCRWGAGPLTLHVMDRHQRDAAILVADPDTGATEVRATEHDDVWLDVIGGVPAWTPDGRLVTTAPEGDRRRVLVDGAPVGPADLEVREVVDVGATDAVVVGSREPTATEVWRVPLDGTSAECLTPEPGVHAAVVGGDVVVITSAALGDDIPTVVSNGGRTVASIESVAERPVVSPVPTLLRAGPRELRTAVLLPSSGGDGPLPVLVDPYGGPHAQRVVQSRRAFLAPQWWADQGFAVVVADGRGTPGRGRAWDRAVHLDLAAPVLEDQIDALHGAAERQPRLDLSRVAIRGWSFGGYLAALAVLRRPDVFHAAVAGAPVTDWRLYDTFYTERYLGLPDEEPDAYARTSLLGDASRLERPLLLVHGLADDNVVAAHTLQLSRALFEAGRPHRVLPLSGITHMTPQEVVAENLLLFQLAFLREALGMRGAD